ncbi:hypothetical protein ACFQ64_19425 [Streptomyces sp. NPDC056460]|uniref:hypothetical protein n=1 Tax=Streptomyces sp. NPDC056460 TaxID=3345825 RepID=UPI0036892FDB
MTTDVLTGLRRSERAVLKALENLDGQSVSVANLAQATGYSVQTVTVARRRLRDLRLISFTPGTGHTPTRYTVPSPTAAVPEAPAMLGGFHLGRTLSSGALHLLNADGELPSMPVEFRADTVCRPVPETAPLMELARGGIFWDRLCRACLQAIGASPGAGETSSVETFWQVQVWRASTRVWLPIGRSFVSEEEALQERAARREQHPELLFRAVVRAVTETVLP